MVFQIGWKERLEIAVRFGPMELSQSETNHFGAGGVFELDLGDSEIPLTPKQEREQKLLEKQLKKKQKNSSRPN